MNATTKELSAKELQETDPKLFEKEYWEWHRDALSYYDWWDYTYEDAKEQGKAMGFDIDDIQFTGFHSQGDGASWMGDVVVQKYIEANNLQADPEWFALYEMLKDGLAEPRVRIYSRDSHYSHSNTMRSEWEEMSHDDEDEITSGPLMGALVADLLDTVDWEARESDMLEDAKSYADDIYKQLRDEYEHLTSEESFIEHCDANDVFFEIEVEEEESM